MRSKIVKLRNMIGVGSCAGTIDSRVPFRAGLVELSEQNFPPPHGTAHVMFARQRGPAPDFRTKELMLSFTKGLENKSYELKPDSHEVRVTFADNSDPANPIVYTQRAGEAVLLYESDAAVFSGKLLTVIMENEDNDVGKTITLDIIFEVKGDIVTLNFSPRCAA